MGCFIVWFPDPSIKHLAFNLGQLGDQESVDTPPRNPLSPEAPPFSPNTPQNEPSDLTGDDLSPAATPLAPTVSSSASVVSCTPITLYSSSQVLCPAPNTVTVTVPQDTTCDSSTLTSNVPMNPPLATSSPVHEPMKWQASKVYLITLT